MHRFFAVGLLAASFFLITTAASCGPRDGGSGVKTAAERVAEWIGLWKDDAAVGTSPPRFTIPTPPAITLSPAAVTTRDDVAQASARFKALRDQVDYEGSEKAAEYTKEVMCNWFGWYVEDPTHDVPDEAAFLNILLESGLKVLLRSPPSQQLQEANGLFRNAILRAKEDTSDTERNEAIAAACSIPLPS